MPLATTVVFELTLFPFKSAAKLFLEKHDCDTASNVELVWHAWKFFHMLFLIIGISFSNILSQMQSNTFVRNAVILLVYFCCSLSRQSKFPTRWVRVGNASCKLQYKLSQCVQPWPPLRYPARRELSYCCPPLVQRVQPHHRRSFDRCTAAVESKGFFPFCNPWRRPFPRRLVLERGLAARVTVCCRDARTHARTRAWRGTPCSPTSSGVFIDMGENV